MISEGQTAEGREQGILRWVAWLGVPLLLIATMRLPYVGEAAEGGSACDAVRKTANLNFTLKDMHGKDFNLASHKGKVIVLDFWATWCPPCKVEIPWFVEFQNAYGAKGFTVIGVSVDDAMPKLKPFAAEYKMNYPVLVGDGRDDIKGPKAFGPMWGLPRTFVIGRDGKICKTHVGFSQKATLEAQIKSLL
jgi:cytochrome c biogenesis protein CcmG/thiol:disulfide interchange protein DsbE